MFFSQPCNLPENIKKYLEYFDKREINCGILAYRVCDFSTDVDIFINNFDFNEKLFLVYDNKIKIISNVKLYKSANVYIKIWCNCKQWNT